MRILETWGGGRDAHTHTHTKRHRDLVEVSHPNFAFSREIHCKLSLLCSTINLLCNVFVDDYILCVYMVSAFKGTLSATPP